MTGGREEKEGRSKGGGSEREGKVHEEKNRREADSDPYLWEARPTRGKSERGFGGSDSSAGPRQDGQRLLLWWADQTVSGAEGTTSARRVPGLGFHGVIDDDDSVRAKGD